MSVIDAGTDGGNPVWTFDSFREGVVIGSSTQKIDADFSEQWLSIYEPLDGRKDLPYGVVQLVTMKAYAEVVAPRPPGNIHAAQQCFVHEIPGVERALFSEVSCIAKHNRRGRKMVDFKVDTRDLESQRPMCSSVLKICWAI